MVTRRRQLYDKNLALYDLTAALQESGIKAIVISGNSELGYALDSVSQDIALLDTTSMRPSDIRSWVKSCSEIRVPVIALVPEGQLTALDVSLDLNDFIIIPLHNRNELVVRIKRILWRIGSSENGGVIRVGSLVINPTSYEVSVQGSRVHLRFKEYELLKLMATNVGRVYTREALLNIIWGYDYFGGTRTVDVHIRRLRSKIENPEHPFIETIWNVGYRFRDGGPNL